VFSAGAGYPSLSALPRAALRLLSGDPARCGGGARRGERCPARGADGRACHPLARRTRQCLARRLSRRRRMAFLAGADRMHRAGRKSRQRRKPAGAPRHGKSDPLRRSAVALSRPVAGRLQCADLAVDGRDRGVGNRQTRPPARALICPTGKSVNWVSSPLCKNIPLRRRPKSDLEPAPFRPEEGRWPSSRTLGRDAVDAAASGAQVARGRMMLLRTAKSCGPDASTPASSLREEPQTTVTNKPDHRGEHEVSRKTIACGNAGCSGATVVTTLVCYLHFAHEAAGAAGIRHSPRPLSGERFMHNPGASRREGAYARLELAV